MSSPSSSSRGRARAPSAPGGSGNPRSARRRRRSRMRSKTRSACGSPSCRSRPSAWRAPSACSGTPSGARDPARPGGGGMKPKDLQRVLDADLQHVWHPITQHRILTKQPPKVIVGAHGSTVVDAEGREYLDGMAGLWCVNVGYGRREIAEAVYRQLLELPYYPHTQANVPAATLANRLTALVGGEPSHTYFVNSGTEANEAAFKLVRQYHRQVHAHEPRFKIIGRHYAYHGTSLATLAAGALPERKSKYEPLGDGFLHVPPVSCLRRPFGNAISTSIL